MLIDLKIKAILNKIKSVKMRKKYGKNNSTKQRCKMMKKKMQIQMECPAQAVLFEKM